MAGKRGFTGNGASAGVSNAGTITVGRGGYAALIGGTVTNSGSIYVPLGKVGLGSGEQATLDFSGDGFLQVALPTSAKPANDKSDGALIQNSGTIKADGGAVIMSAATAQGSSAQRHQYLRRGAGAPDRRQDRGDRDRRRRGGTGHGQRQAHHRLTQGQGRQHHRDRQGRCVLAGAKLNPRRA